MCGRFVGFNDEQEREITDIINEAGRNTAISDSQLSFKTTGEIFPTDRIPVLFGVDGNLTAAIMQWGFPGFQDRNSPKRKPRPLINTKSETAATLYTWKDSVAARRCIIPSNGFYEWQHGGVNDKVKYRFALRDEVALFMAAIYKVFPMPGGGELRHFSILTAAANDSMRDVHSRMPVVIRQDEFDKWLFGDYSKLFERNSLKLLKTVA